MKPSLVRVFALAVLVSLGAGCAGVTSPEHVRAPRPGEGRLVVYFNGPAKSALEVAFDLAGIEAITEEGVKADVLRRPASIHSLEVVDRQIRLGDAFLPEGRYRKLRLTIPRARVRLEGKWIDLSTAADGFVVDTDFEVRARQATPLFMTWDVGRTIEREAFFRPAFAFEGRAQELRGVVSYVTNEGTGTVSVIDRAVDRIVSEIEVGPRPRGVVVTPDNTRAFVVNSGPSTLTVIDVSTNRVLHTTNLEVGANPSDVVITPDGRALYVSNTALNSVSVTNTSSFHVLQTIPVGLRPVALLLVPARNRLFVANTGHNTITVIDTTRNTVSGTITVEFQPSGLSLDTSGTQLFVTHLGSPRLSIVSLSTLRVVRALDVGTATAALPDPDPGSPRVFVSRSQFNRLSLFDLTVNAELGWAVVGAGPGRLVLDTDRDKLYVLNQGSSTVTVVDRLSRRTHATIEVGQRPWGIASVP